MTDRGQRHSAPQTIRVIEGGTLIDGTGRAPLRDAVIVITGNTITAVGEKGKVSYPAEALLIPAAGKFILPGLCDMHVHWYSWMPEFFLVHGVTAAVDLATDDYILSQKEALADGRMPGPRLFTSAPFLSGRLLWDRMIAEPCATPQMVRRLVQQIGPGRAQYNLAKAYTELTPDELQALVEESHQAGRNVIAHLGSLDARQAANLGVDALAHATGIALAAISDPVKAEELRMFTRLGAAVDYPLFMAYHAYMDAAKMDELVELLVEKNVRIEADLVNTAGRWLLGPETYRREDAQMLADPNLHYLPAYNRGRFLYYGAWELADAAQRDLFRKGYATFQEFLRKFIGAGGTMLAGTDTASVITGRSLHRELELLVEAGLTPMQAIQAATKNNFEFLQESALGTIEPGKLADIILLRADPLADIRNIRTVETVIKDGQVMDARFHAGFVNAIPRPASDSGHPIPRPFIRVVYPGSARGLHKELKLIIEGLNFVDESVVLFDSVEAPTEPVKASMIRETVWKPVYTQLQATVPAQLVNRFGTYQVTVKNPPPPGGTSNSWHFFIAE